MKKKILISSISIIFVCFISFLILSTHSVNAAGGEDKYVAAKSGINLRSGPDKSSKVITLIPFGSKVTIEKSEGNEIFLDERYGKWVNVKFGNKTGWVFSGFLCDFKPDTVIKVVADFYRDRYRKNEYFSKYKEYTHFKDNEVYIENIIDNYILLEIPTSEVDNISPSKGHVVWRYDVKQKKFFETHNSGHERTIYLLYLDKDSYPDLAVVYGCCSSASLEIYYGSENAFVKGYELPVELSSDVYFHLAVGNCGDMEFVCGKINGNENWKDATRYFFRFNCDKRKFEKYAEGKVIESDGTITSIDFKNASIVIKDKKDSKDTSYKFYTDYTLNKYYAERLKKFKKGDGISFEYIAIAGKKIILYIDSKSE